MISGYQMHIKSDQAERNAGRKAPTNPRPPPRPPSPRGASAAQPIWYRDRGPTSSGRGAGPPPGHRPVVVLRRRAGQAGSCREIRRSLRWTHPGRLAASPDGRPIGGRARVSFVTARGVSERTGSGPAWRRSVDGRAGLKSDRVNRVDLDQFLTVMGVDHHPTVEQELLVPAGRPPRDHAVGGGAGLDLYAHVVAGSHSLAVDRHRAQKDVDRPEPVGAVLGVSDRAAVGHGAAPGVDPAAEPEPLERRAERTAVAIERTQRRIRTGSEMVEHPAGIAVRKRGSDRVNLEEDDRPVAVVSQMRGREPARPGLAGGGG